MTTPDPAAPDPASDPANCEDLLAPSDRRSSQNGEGGGEPAGEPGEWGPVRRGSDHPALRSRTPARPEDWFPAELVAESRAYNGPLRKLRLARTIVAAVVLVAFVLGEGGPRVIEWTGVQGWAVQLLVVVLALQLVDLIHAPWFDGYTELVYDKRWGLSTQTVKGWLVDIPKGVLFGTMLLTLLFLPVYAVIRAIDLWWLWGWGVFVVMLLVLTFVYPVVFMPIFNKFTPIDDEVLRRRIQAVADRAGVTIRGSFTMDASRRTRRDNAFVAGFGNTKRVVVFDTMLEHPPEVVEQVVAHEIGHYRLKHTVKTVPVLALLLLATFAFLGWLTSWDWALQQAGVETVRDPAALPLLLIGFGLASNLTGIVSSWYSRVKEREADLEALELLGRPDAFVEVWRRMVPKNRMDLDPPWWRRLTATHPDPPERMAFAADWAARNGVPFEAPAVAEPVGGPAPADG